MKHIFIIIVIYVVSFSASVNTFFITTDSMTLECNDINKITKISDKMVDISYTESGRKKIYKITKNNINGKLALVADGELIFMNIIIREAIAKKPVKTGKDFYSQGSVFSAQNNNIDHFINTFRHCKGLVKTKKQFK